MRILIADKFPARQLEQLGASHDVVFDPGRSADSLELAGFDALVVRSTRVTADALSEADALGLIVRAGAGVNTIDLTAAAGLGIYVCNAPGKNAVAVAELAVGLLLAIDRNIPDNVADLRAGRWDKSRYQKTTGVKGRQVGIVGLGAIGMAFAERMAAFETTIHVIAKPTRDEPTAARLAELDAVEHPDLFTLAAACDVVSFHVPLTPDTTGLIGPALLNTLPEGAIVLNTSRGELIDAPALIAAMDQRNIRAGLDVYPDEPAAGSADYSSELAGHPNVYGTHHIGASTEQAQDATADEVVAVIAEYSAGRTRNCVNLETEPLGGGTLVVRHLNRVGVLSDVLRLLRESNVNIEQMENQIFSGGRAACATLHVTGDLSDELVAAVRAVEPVISVGHVRKA